MKITIGLLAMTVALISGCVTPSVQLEERGAKIPIKRDLSKKDLKPYAKVKYIVCEQGSNGRALQNNMESCENHLRNEAARVGAEFVVVETVKQGETEHFGQCNNCVMMTGWAYETKKPE